MEFVSAEKLQLGQYGLLLGSLINLVSGSLEVEVYCCDACRKLEFYAVDSESAAAAAALPRHRVLIAVSSTKSMTPDAPTAGCV